MRPELSERPQRLWRLEGVIGKDSETGKPSIYRWRINAELEATLLLIIEPSQRIFEVARHLDHPTLVDIFIENEAVKKQALDSLNSDSPWVDVFWRGDSLQELENFCESSYLPLPPDYLELWENSL